MTRDFLEMGALLSTIEEHSLWVGYAESFADYCDDPEIGISYRTARKLVRVYREAERLGLVNSQALLRAGVERAAAVLPAAADGEDAVVRLQEASCLPVREVQLMYRGQDPQLKALESALGRFEQLNTSTRVLLMICQYWRLTYDERLEFWLRLHRHLMQGQEQSLPAGGPNGEAR
jgi:hypothetical protein